MKNDRSMYMNEADETKTDIIPEQKRNIIMVDLNAKRSTSEILLICPECKSVDKINQYRMLTGPIWCSACGYRVEQKEISNPFVHCLKDYTNESPGIKGAKAGKKLREALVVKTEFEKIKSLLIDVAGRVDELEKALILKLNE